MDQPSRKRKLEDEIDQPIKKRMLGEKNNFTELIDDCIDEILNWLNLDDLCAVSRTCKKLQNLSIRQFQRKYPKKHIYITEKQLPGGATAVCLSPNELYVKCFLPYIQNVCVDLPVQRDYKLTMDLVAFMQTHINQVPKKIIFGRGQFYINKSFAEGIKAILENVEHVQFTACYGKKVNFYDEILMHCKQLKYLKILPSYHTHFDQSPPTLPVYQHPHLEFFQCNFMDKEMTENLADFLRLNSTIKQLSCHFGKQLSHVDLAKCVESFADHSKNLENVYFRMEQCDEENYTNLTLMENGLQVLDNSNRIKRFELDVDQISLAEKSDPALSVLTGVRCNGESLPSIIKSNLPYTKLKVLIFTGLTVLSQQSATDASNLLPNLEVLSFQKFKFDDSENSGVILTFLTQFAKRSKVLKEIYFFAYDVTHYYKSIDIELLNMERKNLDGACKLTIYLSEYFMKNVFKQVDNNPKSLVHLTLADDPPKLGIF